jgi:hypothetical protein
MAVREAYSGSAAVPEIQVAVPALIDHHRLSRILDYRQGDALQLAVEGVAVV